MSVAAEQDVHASSGRDLLNPLPTLRGVAGQCIRVSRERMVGDDQSPIGGGGL